MSTADFNEFLDGQFAAQDASGAGDPPAAPPAEVPASVPAEKGHTQTEEPLDLDGELEGDKFDRPYVERLRREAAAARTKAKELEQVFDGYADEEREGLATLARLLKEDPKAAAAEMKAAYDAIMAQYQEQEPVSNDDFSDADRILTVGEYQKLQEANAVAAEQRAIEAEAKELGYKVDPRDTDYRLLLLTAQNQTKTGSIQEAHQILKAREQAVVDRYLAAKAADAEEAYRAPADNAGQIPSNAEPIKSFKDARSALENYIAQQRA